MKRPWMIAMTLLIVAAGVYSPRSLNVSASGRAHEPAGKKVCKTVVKKVHGKKQRVKVCKTVKLKPTPSPTPTLSRFAGIAGLAVGPDGNVYVLDAQGPAAIAVLDPSGNTLRSWGSHGSAQGQINQPAFLALDSIGNVYITQEFENRIQKFSNDGTFLRMWGSSGGGPGQFDGVAGIGVGKDGTVYVADQWHSRIETFSPDGAFLGEIPIPSESSGVASRPLGIAVDSQGDILVAAFGAGQVDELSPSGERLATFGGSDQPPRGIAVDGQGNVYVTTGFPGPGDYLEKFAPDGTPLARWTPAAPYNPVQVAVDRQGDVYVAEFSYQSPGPPPAIVKLSSTLEVLATWK